MNTLGSAITFPQKNDLREHEQGEISMSDMTDEKFHAPCAMGESDATSPVTVLNRWACLFLAEASFSRSLSSLSSIRCSTE